MNDKTIIRERMLAILGDRAFHTFTRCFGGAQELGEEYCNAHEAWLDADPRFPATVPLAVREVAEELASEMQTAAEMADEAAETALRCDEWRREQAMELGMGLGVDAYNDAMGYALEVRSAEA